MYQQRAGIRQTEEDFNGLMRIFNKTIINTSSIESIDTEFDLTKTYQVTHVCIWNNPYSLGTIVTIEQKDNKLALCRPAENTEVTVIPTVLNFIFRLEDLKEIM